VHVLNVVDGCMPADIATGSRAETEEERRLLYVAMTRARDELSLWVPQRFHVTQQRAWGDTHMYALRSRFISDTMLPHFDVITPMPLAAQVADDAAVPAPPVLDLSQLLRGVWHPQE
jgi:DNA helicase II / ATP-dependent DNA helicase PcrA